MTRTCQVLQCSRLHLLLSPRKILLLVWPLWSTTPSQLPWTDIAGLPGSCLWPKLIVTSILWIGQLFKTMTCQHFGTARLCLSLNAIDYCPLMGCGRPVPLLCELNLLGLPYGAGWVNKESQIQVSCPTQLYIAFSPVQTLPKPCITNLAVSFDLWSKVSRSNVILENIKAGVVD